MVRYGRLPGYRLSERGRDQVRRAAEHLRTLQPALAKIVTSPLERTIETATIVQEVLGLPEIVSDERLLEAPSYFDGLSKLAFLEPRHWRVLWNPFEPSWGEPFRAVAERMHAAIAEHRAAADGPILFVSHQSPIWIARHAYRSRRPPWTSPSRPSQGSITTLEFRGERCIAETYWSP